MVVDQDQKVAALAAFVDSANGAQLPNGAAAGRVPAIPGMPEIGHAASTYGKTSSFLDTTNYLSYVVIE